MYTLVVYEEVQNTCHIDTYRTQGPDLTLHSQGHDTQSPIAQRSSQLASGDGRGNISRAYSHSCVLKITLNAHPRTTRATRPTP